MARRTMALTFAIALLLTSCHSNKDASSSSGGGASTPSSILSLISWNCARSSPSYFIAQGEVKNVSASSQNSVEAVATFRTSTGPFVNSADAFIDLQPVAPGETSTCSVYGTTNAAITNATIIFKYFAGGQIATAGLTEVAC